MEVIIIACFIILLTSLVGVFLISKKTQKFIDKYLHILIAFAVGVFSFVVFSLVSETLEHSDPLFTTSAVAIGFLAMMILPKIFTNFHHHHTGHMDHTHSEKGAFRILISDGFHNITDGVLISASFLANEVVGVGVFFSVLIHEIVQGITEFFVLRQAGFSVKKSLFFSFLAQSTIFIGAIGAYYFLELFSYLETVFLGLAGGGFLALLLQDLIPTSFLAAKKEKNFLLFTIALLLGVGLMFLVNFYFPH